MRAKMGRFCTMRRFVGQHPAKLISLKTPFDRKVTGYFFNPT
jgi:hypothetical protein